MKLSVVYRKGFTRVRGGAVVRVVSDHACSVGSQNAYSDEPRTYDKPHMVAVKGDLAIEIVAVATGNVIGHAYISGAAIGLINYGCSATWFEGARGFSADVRPLFEHGVDRVTGGILEMCADAQSDLVVCEIVTKDQEEMRSAFQGIVTLLERAGHQGAADVFFKIRSEAAGDIATIHSQPPARASKYPAPPFFMELALLAGLPAFSFMPVERFRDLWSRADSPPGDPA